MLEICMSLQMMVLMYVKVWVTDVTSSDLVQNQGKKYDRLRCHRTDDHDEICLPVNKRTEHSH